MKAKLITNPYIVYSVIFIVTMLIYIFHWSDLYPDLSWQLLLFILSTAAINLVIGLLLHKTNHLSFKEVSFGSATMWIVTLFIFAGTLAECAYMGLIPLLAIIHNSGYDYTTFGIPTFHVILVTFNSFWAVFIFHNYLCTKKKMLLICYVLCLLPAIIIFNRGMFLMILASSLFVLFMATKHLKKLLIGVGLFLTLILFLFGLAGNIRITGDESVNDVILDWGKATESFKKSPIPDEFFWSYLYLSSPLANLQETIDRHHVSDFSAHKFGSFVNGCFLPDFISKENKYFLYPAEHVEQISPAFNVATVYGDSFSYLGWWGMILMFLYMTGLIFFIILALPPGSKFFVTGIAILNCVMLFNIFDNMFSFSGLSMQLFYPLFFSLFSRINFSAKKIA